MLYLLEKVSCNPSVTEIEKFDEDDDIVEITTSFTCYNTGLQNSENKTYTLERSNSQQDIQDTSYKIGGIETNKINCDDTFSECFLDMPAIKG